MLLRADRPMLAVAITLDVAFHAGRTGTVSGADIAERLGEVRRGIEPVLQLLSRAGILHSTRGPKGGYRLGQAARDVTLGAVVAAVNEGGLDPAAIQGSSPLRQAVINPLWEQMEAELRQSLEKVTVAELLRRAAAAGLRRPCSEPLNFSI